jgi:hypothetical protein
VLASPGAHVKADITARVPFPARFAPRVERCALFDDRGAACSAHTLDVTATSGVRIPIRSVAQEWGVIAVHLVSIYTCHFYSR